MAERKQDNNSAGSGSHLVNMYVMFSSRMTALNNDGNNRKSFNIKKPKILI